MGEPRSGDNRPNRSIRRRVDAKQLSALSDEQLLDLRFCDLGLEIEGTWLVPRIEKVCEELQRRHIRFRPHFWLSEEWFTPDGVPGVGIPFYLAHSRLRKLEERMMLDVEGGTHEWCMRILRHEAGHAIDNAYALHRRRSWQQVFGKYTSPYPNVYQPRPYSKRFVLHLDSWYAQSHPAEDFAETFAVWLTPDSRWRRRYAGWPAIKKLTFVDQLMREIAGKKPKVTTREQCAPLRELRGTLGKHYRKKQARYGEEHPSFYDRDLRRLFGDDESGLERAAAFLRRFKPELRRLVAQWTGEYQYRINEVLQDMIDRSRELRLAVNQPEQETKLQAAVLLTVQTMNYLHSGRHRLAL